MTGGATGGILVTGGVVDVADGVVTDGIDTLGDSDGGILGPTGTVVIERDDTGSVLAEAERGESEEEDGEKAATDDDEEGGQ